MTGTPTKSKALNQQITGAYLNGIKEGRSFLKANPDISRADMEEIAWNCNTNANRHSGAMADCFRGERDFWRNQIKKLQKNT